MRKPILAAIAIGCLTLTAGMCEQEKEVVVNVCKGKAQVACEQDPRCYWKLPEDADGTAKCKARE